ncbi:MAG TPA: hypothetical protein PLO99_14330 [Chitinophagaceae bacterium]|nr:hypothetical protein [Chitinophagaceae bacterium]
MKIRIKGNTIRYRLTKTEVADFGQQGFVEEKTEFPNGPALHYRIERKAGIADMETSFKGNSICIFIPEKIAEEWTTTDIIGFSHKEAMENGKELFLLIEKDFVCLDHTFEDQSDNYPNPNKVC